MNEFEARVVAADVLINGVGTMFSFADIVEARSILSLHSLMHNDARPEQGAILILSCLIDTVTILTSEV